VAFFRMKWDFTQKNRKDTKKDATLLQGEDMRHLYNLCRGKNNELVTKDILKRRFDINLEEPHQETTPSSP
jgi:hypothetical protein